MRTMIITLGVIVMAMSACKKERENIDTRIPEKQQRLSAVKWSSTFTTTEKNLKYDKDGYLAEVASLHYFNLEDKEDRQASAITTRMVYERDANHRITRTSFYDEYERVGEYTYEGENLVEINYTENGWYASTEKLRWYDGRLVYIATFNKNQLVSDKRMLYDNQGNLQEIKYYNSAKQWFRVYNISYDNTPHVFNGIKDALYEPFLYNSVIPEYSMNNIVVADYEQYDLPNTGTWVYHLSYDEKGRVTKSVKNNGQETIEYSYEEY